MFPRHHLLLALFLLGVALPVRAQGGCVDSPESPTIVLALVGAIGAIAVGTRASRKNKS
jgi:XrtJ-associated TM-motif-TM protein